MTDAEMELIEKAAKAAGYWYRKHELYNCMHVIVRPSQGKRNKCKKQWVVWNPLESDGDALRLAVKLRLHISNPGSESWAQSYCGHDDGWQTSAEPHGSCAYAATRRAITQAAAAIQEAKEAQ